MVILCIAVFRWLKNVAPLLKLLHQNSTRVVVNLDLQAKKLVFQGKCYGYCHFEFPSLTFLFFLCSVLIPLVFTVPLFFAHLSSSDSQQMFFCKFVSEWVDSWCFFIICPKDFKFRRPQAKLVNRDLETGNSWNEEEPTSLLAKCQLTIEQDHWRPAKKTWERGELLIRMPPMCSRVMAWTTSRRRRYLEWNWKLCQRLTLLNHYHFIFL